MISSTKTPIKAMTNDSLLEYLGAICGVDYNAASKGMKADLVLATLGNRIGDVTSNTGNWIGEGVANALRGLVTWQRT
jgi:hypothetical protein